MNHASTTRRALLPLILAAATACSVCFLPGANGESRKPDPAAETAEPLAALVGLMLEVDDDELRRDVLEGMQVALRGRRNLGVPDGWRELYTKLMASPDATVREQAVLLAIIFRDEQAMRSLLDVVKDPEQPAIDRVRAITALGDARDPSLGMVLQDLVAADPKPDAEVLAAAVRGLASVPDADVPKLLLTEYPRLDGARRDAVATMSSRPAWALALLAAVEEDRIPREHVSAFDARQMASLGNADVDRRLAAVWGNVRPTSKDRERLLKRYRGELTPAALEEANLAEGRRVFAKTCSGCHRLFDAGRAVGPELTGSQRRNVEYVLQNLVDPNAIIGRDYQVTIVLTVEGRVLNGVVAEETDNVLVLRTATEDVTISKEDIDDRRRSNVSMMPEGMLEKLTPNERRDLAAYLASPRQVPLPPGDDSAATN